jgi:hypothetical protein
MSNLAEWHRIRWGLTEPELVQAIRSCNLRHVPRETFKDLYTELILPGLDMDGYRFDVLFQMDVEADRLKQVLIRHDGPPNREPRNAFEAARRMLEARFGLDGAASSDIHVWSFPTTIVHLQMLFVKGSMSQVTITYQRQVACTDGCRSSPATYHGQPQRQFCSSEHSQSPRPMEPIGLRESRDIAVEGHLGSRPE